MADCKLHWGRYEELRPDQLEEIVAEAPVAYWPLGLLEHHGWHLPVGFDGVKAHRLCCRFAERTGGVVLPVMWWGAIGGHQDFMWTLYQPPDAARAIFENTIRKLIQFDFQAIVLLCGHYPWHIFTRELVPELEKAHPDVLFIHGTEAGIGRPEVNLKGDHAARWETTYGQVLLPELVDMDALRPGRDAASSWPEGKPPEPPEKTPVKFDASHPLFAQGGQDARTADVEEGKDMVDRLVAHIAARVNTHLSR